MATQLRAPNAYDHAIASDIIQRVASGETVRSATRAVGLDFGIFYRWKREDPDLEAAFEEARLNGAHAIADEALRIVDGDDLEDMVPMNLDGVRGLVNRKTQLAAAGGDPVARARLRFEGRMKLLAKWFPQHYGDKLLHAGHDGGAIKSETALSVKELAAQLRARASGVVIDGDAKEMLTDESERFNGSGSATEIDLCAPTESCRSARPMGRRLTNTSDITASPSQPTQSASRASSGAARATAPAQRASGPKAEGSASSAAGEPIALERAAAGGNRRSRGAGGRGGGEKRGASPETGGTPPTDIFEKNSSPQSTSYLHTPSDLATPPEFPPDEDWAPEDYV